MKEENIVYEIKPEGIKEKEDIFEKSKINVEQYFYITHTLFMIKECLDYAFICELPSSIEYFESQMKIFTNLRKLIENGQTINLDQQKFSLTPEILFGQSKKEKTESTLNRFNKNRKYD